MAGKLQFTLSDYQAAAHKFRKELLMLPIIGISDTLKHMTGCPGIRYNESVATMTGNAQFAPYKPARRSDFNLNLDFRTLETYFGSVVAQFEPNSAISTLLGLGATKGDGQATTPTAKHVLALIARGLTENLNNAIWSGVRNASGDTTQDLFDGFDTITQADITAGKIAASNKNYIKLNQAITKANAVDIAKDILFSLDPHLRAKKLKLYCSQDFADKYNEGYLLTHGATPYNNQYNQVFVEGSNNNLEIVPLFNKADSKFFHICPQSNMLVGYDQMSDVEDVMVKEYDPFILSYIATMFFGVQFESIDKSQFMAVELADETSSDEDEEEEGSGESGSGSGSGSGESGSGSGSGSGSQSSGTTVTVTAAVDSSKSSWGDIQINDRTAAKNDSLTVASGTSVTIKATATSGHYFSEWNDGNSDNPRTITPTADVTYTASFEQS